MQFSDCSVVPAKSEHAVQSASFICELAANVSAETIKKAIELYENSPELKAKFPRKTEHQGYLFDLSGAGAHKDEGLAGVNFDRVGSDGTTELAIFIHSKLLTFTCNRYTRWEPISNEAIELFLKFIDLILPNPGVAVFGLQYVDEFFISGKRETFRPTMMFDSKCKLLAPQFMAQEDLWHNHSGWFENSDGVRTLNNLNISLLSQPENNVAQIVSAHRVFLPKPISDKGTFTKEAKDRFEYLHKKNKALLDVLLNDAAKKAIKLGAIV
jgi:uncharacterized protein (TIGR04255 family)